MEIIVIQKKNLIVIDKIFIGTLKTMNHTNAKILEMIKPSRAENASVEPESKSSVSVGSVLVSSSFDDLVFDLDLRDCDCCFVFVVVVDSVFPDGGAFG